MKQNLRQLCADNREFQVCFYDEPMCEQFIGQHFTDDVLRAYKRLVPNSYKSDLWRYCVLYVYGGIYIDIKFKCINGYRFIHLTDQEYFVRDIDASGGGIVNGLLIALPKSPFMFRAIRKVVSNVQTGYYGTSALLPTGPLLLKEVIDPTIQTQLSLVTLSIPGGRTIVYVMFRDHLILTYYREYRDEQAKHQDTQHYTVLWDKKQIYSL